MVRPSAWAVLRLTPKSNFVALLHRQISRLGTLQDLVHVGGGATYEVEIVRTVAQQKPSPRIIQIVGDGRQPMLDRQRCDLGQKGGGDRTGHHEQGIGPLG